MRARVVVVWVVAALAGLALAACITFAASQLSSQHVGLSGEPLSAGRGLAPRAHDVPAAPHSIHTTTGPPSTTRPNSNDGSGDGDASGGDD